MGNGGGSGTYGGTIITGTGNIQLIKTGVGTQTLTGVNTYTGTTAVNGGTLELGVDDCLAQFQCGDRCRHSESCGWTLTTPSAPSIPPLPPPSTSATAAATLAFADSSAVDWTAARSTSPAPSFPVSSLRFGTSNSG